MVKLDPWDSALTPYLVGPGDLVCSHMKQLMYVDSGGALRWVESEVEEHKVDTRLLNCSYRVMRREFGDTEVTFGPEVKFVTPVFVKSHVFRVTCVLAPGQTIYDYLHFNPFWDDTAKSNDEIENESEDKPSVILLGLDSVSRSHAIRYLPQTREFLRTQLDAYDFEGYSKVGENTWPNFMPLLTGQTHRNFPWIQHVVSHFDHVPFLWNEKVMEHFATFFAEDRPDISPFLSDNRRGFKFAPTDFYFRPFTLGTRKFVPTVMKTLAKPSLSCYGVKSYLEFQLDYLKGFVMRYKHKRKFAFFWNNIGHSQFNAVRWGDKPILEFLIWLKQTNQTDNLIFAIMSDHGFRISDAALTHVGRAENNNPLLMIHVPKTLRQKYTWLPEILSANSKKLTSHYDLYQTILDLVTDKDITNGSVKPVQKGLVRRNLFYPIPVDRHCADAGIEEQYCSCQERLNISTTKIPVQSLAKFLVRSINDMLSERQYVCYNLNLRTVTEASVSYSNNDIETNYKLKKSGIFNKYFCNQFADISGRYSIVFQTIPGMASFEGVVDFTEYSKGDVTSKMNMIGQPVRLDRYGNQSHCVNDASLRPFCYCKGHVTIT